MTALANVPVRVNAQATTSVPVEVAWDRLVADFRLRRGSGTGPC